MNNIKFNDWQEMALKKDTEAIIKKLNTQEPIIFSMCWEIVIAVGAIIVDHLFDTEEINIQIWIICVALAVVPPLVIILVKTLKWVISIKKVKAGVYNIRPFIDTFDNQICYWVMMCDSYSRLISTIPAQKKNERIFLYQEGCYYNNKSIQALYKMKPVIDKVFSADHKMVIKNNLVSTCRLFSVLEMMKQYQEELDNNIGTLQLERSVTEQMNINCEFRKKIVSFISDVNQVFDTQFEWNPPGEKDLPEKT